MPTAFSIRGFRFYFYSNEGEEPMHVHIEKGSGNGKVWLDPISIEYMNGFTTREVNQIMQIISVNFLILKNKWNEHFGQ